MMKLSILDQVPVRKGSSPEQSLNESIEMIQLAESLGYKRYWFAEHHSTRGLASSAPEILIAAAAAATKKIRVGSGGVLLPQYSPYKVAETFRQLSALYPGRIDLGLGRSPGGTEKVRLALTDGHKKSMTDFQRQLNDLIFFLTDTLPPDHPSYGIKAAPSASILPELFLLGLGENSARLSGSKGAGYVFGHFIKNERGERAHGLYKEVFASSPFHDSPSPITAIFIICADTEEKAEELAMSQDLWLLRVEKGLDSRIPDYEEAASYPYTESDREKISHNRRRMVIGSPETVKKQLLELKDAYQAEEFMVLTNVYSFEDRKNSYKLLSKLFPQ
ncbi:LLM class flavin-dependent oxidoreductase [Metabacillus sp. GX 13764]|uniref:LLM class flavin-dependent oxidoreductase n=1 Tax=Metabacillus kandeliae TaxID=2900151 RepID=UPI001E50A16F|nr:LLM class flavin-dependent oxidoreductase [Metabacillus kandeliae]MCD7033574.1 LLM class flavin-dependent oxidoreductase [Metabacillus kandeliae]